MVAESQGKGSGESGNTVRTLAIASVALVAVFLGYDLISSPPGSACDNVFQQASMQMGIQLKHLDTEGSLVLGKQKVQALTEQAQLTALNLKTCCIVLDSGKVSPDQFLQCKSTAGSYEKKLDTIVVQLAEVTAAREEGQAEVAEQKLQLLNATLNKASELSNSLQKQVRELPRPPMEADRQGLYFRDDFDGDALGASWQLLKPDPLRWKYQADQGSLLIVTQKGSVRSNDDSLRNQFILNETIPSDDFEATIKVSIQIQGQQNSVSFALWQDKDNYLEIGYRGFEHGYNVRRSPFFTKELQGQRNKIEATPKGNGSVQNPELIYLKITKQGNKYSGFYAYADPDADSASDLLAWTEIGTHAWIDFQGRPSLWADNGSGTHYGSGASPEVPVEIDYILVQEAKPVS